MEGAYYTIREVSDLLKVSISTIRRSVRSGKLQVARVGPQKQIRISKGALDSFLASAENSNQIDNQVPSDVTDEDIHFHAQDALDVTHRGTTVRRVDGRTGSGIPWCVLNGDVRDALLQIPSDSINCAITSPPYYWQGIYSADYLRMVSGTHS